MTHAVTFQYTEKDEHSSSTTSHLHICENAGGVYLYSGWTLHDLWDIREHTPSVTVLMLWRNCGRAKLG